MKNFKLKIRKIVKKVLGFSKGSPFLLEYFIYDWHLRLSKLFYKKIFTAQDVVMEMQKMGMKKGSNVFIQSRWAEFFNCTSTPTQLIEEILKVIGPEGTLAMDCEPYKRKGKIYNVKRTPTDKGLLAEAFRRYPGVKRSANARHAVCAIGKDADYMISEHHLGETAWDKKSPYYRHAELNGLLFFLGLGYYYQGTVQHCIESLLKDEVPYYHDMFNAEKTEYHFIDYDGEEKTYWNFDFAKTRESAYWPTKRISKKYLKRKTSQISNLQILCYEAKEMVETLLDLGKKGIDTYYIPSKKGYIFEK